MHVPPNEAHYINKILSTLYAILEFSHSAGLRLWVANRSDIPELVVSCLLKIPGCSNKAMPRISTHKKRKTECEWLETLQWTLTLAWREAIYISLLLHLDAESGWISKAFRISWECHLAEVRSHREANEGTQESMLRDFREAGTKPGLDGHSVTQQVFTEHLLYTAHCPGTKSAANVSKTESTFTAAGGHSATIGCLLPRFQWLIPFSAVSMAQQTIIQRNWNSKD